MNWSITIIGIVTGLLMIAVVIELVRRRSLGERYALLWLLLAAIIILLSAWPRLLQRLADALNIYYAPSILFGLALVFIFAVMIHFSVVLSRQSKGYNRMVQRLSVLEERILRLAEREGDGREAEDEENVDAESD